jgi:hypothetical protein
MLVLHKFCHNPSATILLQHSLTSQIYPYLSIYILEQSFPFMKKIFFYQYKLISYPEYVLL